MRTYLHLDYHGSFTTNLVRYCVQSLHDETARGRRTHAIRMDLQGPLSIRGLDFLLCRLNGQTQQLVGVDIFLR